MRLLFLSILIGFPSWGQDTVQVKRIYSPFPYIAGIQTGKIPYLYLCDSMGVYTEARHQITHLTLAYWSGRKMDTLSIVGNVVPDSICALLSEATTITPFYVFNIIGKLQDKEYYLPSMSLDVLPPENK